MNSEGASTQEGRLGGAGDSSAAAVAEGGGVLPAVVALAAFSISFVSATARRDAGPAWRIRLPSGLVFESSAPLAHDDLLSLLATLAAPR